MTTDATLTPEQLASVVNLTVTEPIEAIVLCWRYIDPDWDTREQRSVRPGDFTLPRSQWEAICSALVAYRSPHWDPLRSTNLAMDWVNVGPSSREDDQ